MEFHCLNLLYKNVTGKAAYTDTGYSTTCCVLFMTKTAGNSDFKNLT